MKEEVILKVGYYGTSQVAVDEAGNFLGYLPLVYWYGNECLLDEKEYPEYHIYTNEVDAKTAAQKIITELQKRIAETANS